MARLARVIVEGIPHHVTHCGNRRGDVFFSDADRRSYLHELSQAAVVRGHLGIRTGVISRQHLRGSSPKYGFLRQTSARNSRLGRIWRLMKMKAIMHGVALLVFLFSQLPVTAADADMSVDLDCPDTLVEGFPWIMTVTIRSKNPTITIFPVPKIDLAAEVKQGVALAFLFESQAHSPIRIGRSNFGELEYGPLDKSISFAPGETVTSVFDMNQLLVGRDLRNKKTAPPEEYNLTVTFNAETWKSAPRKVTVRKQTAEEKRFVEAVQKQGIDLKWFPDVIVRDDLKIPDDIVLPAESAQVRDFIKLLRLAVRNPGAAAKQIDDTKESWGSLRGALTELKYECIAKSEGKDSKASQEMRRTLQADAKMKGRLTRLEKSGGLLDHFAKIREDMKKNEKK